MMNAAGSISNSVHRLTRMPIQNPLQNTPVLHLDGARLRDAFESMAKAAESLGGVEVLINAVNGKANLFQRTFSPPLTDLQQPQLLDACSLMPTVRRRLKLALENYDFQFLRQTITVLAEDVSIDCVDERMAQVTDAFPVTKEYRWVRDLAAEIIHYTNPDMYPLMTRWVWDKTANTGVLREIWFKEYQDEYLDIPDGVQTHLVLRSELEEFLRTAGVYADVPIMIDLLSAWIYAEYIGLQGGSFLKTEFSSSDASISHAIRMLGLDAGKSADGRSRLITADGRRHIYSNTIDTSTH